MSLYASIVDSLGSCLGYGSTHPEATGFSEEAAKTTEKPYSDADSDEGYPNRPPDHRPPTKYIVTIKPVDPDLRRTVWLEGEFHAPSTSLSQLLEIVSTRGHTEKSTETMLGKDYLTLELAELDSDTLEGRLKIIH